MTYAKEEMPPKSLGTNLVKEKKVSVPVYDSKKEGKKTNTKKPKKPKSESKENVLLNKVERTQEDFFVVEFVKNLQENVLDIEEKKNEDEKKELKFEVEEINEDDFKGVDIEQLQKIQMQVNFFSELFFSDFFF